ncbi:MAG: hypothetical protein LBG92_03965 [Prevotellaceae bacterium]|nr:hypothetical protein [Prevotellaceae bacterium]
MPLFRELVGGVLRNPNVTDDDLAAMELNRPDSIHTPAPVPSTWPVVLTDLNTPNSVILHFTDSASGKRAKPHKVSGAVVRYAILAAPPTDMDELNNSVLDTQTPCLLTFPEAQRGNRLYYCLAWQNTRGEKGPWSRIEMAIVP